MMCTAIRFMKVIVVPRAYAYSRNRTYYAHTMIKPSIESGMLTIIRTVVITIFKTRRSYES